MKATVSATEIKEALRKVATITKERVALEVLKGVLFEFTSDTCYLTTSNLNQSVTSKIKSKGDSFKFVYFLVDELCKASKFFKGDVSFELEGDKIIIESNGKKIEQISGTEELFPEFFT